jgi:hypothetical protein
MPAGFRIPFCWAWTLNELLFDWIGTEVGVFGIKGIPDPVFYLKVSDQGQKAFCLRQALANSLLSGR